MERPNDMGKMADIARRRLQTIPDDYKAAIVRDADNVPLDQEFLALARKSATNDYHVDLGWEFFDAMGTQLQTIKDAALVQLADQEDIPGRKRRVVFEQPTNVDDGSTSAGNSRYRRPAKRQKA
jgi:hypothetical protein